MRYLAFFAFLVFPLSGLTSGSGPTCANPTEVINAVAQGQAASRVLAGSQTPFSISADPADIARAQSIADDGFNFGVDGLSRTSSGDLFVLRLKEGRTNWLTPTRAFQGDPSSYEKVFGPEMSRFFGFQSLSANQRTVPSAEYLAQQISRYNRLAKPEDQLSLSFYTPRTERVSDLEYIREYALNGRLPMARSGREALHDANIHTPSMLLPKQVVDHDRKRAEALINFYTFAHKSTENNPALREQVKQIFERLFKERTELVDIATARLALVMANHTETIARRNLNPRLMRFEIGENDLPIPGYPLVNGGMSPENYLYNLSIDNRGVQRLLTQFLNQQRTQNPTRYREFYQAELNMSLDEYVRELNRRLRSIPATIRAGSSE